MIRDDFYRRFKRLLNESFVESVRLLAEGVGEGADGLDGAVDLITGLQVAIFGQADAVRGSSADNVAGFEGHQVTEE
jgi:hypothetical protein